MKRLGLMIGQIGRMGGMEKQAALLSRELVERGMEVTLFVSGFPERAGKSGSLELGAIATKHLFHSRHAPLLGKQLLRVHCGLRRISHLIAFNVENVELAVSADLDVKLAMNVRGTKFSTDHLLAERYRRAAEKCDLVITNSSNTARLLQDAEIAEGKEIEIIHNGIELPPIQLSKRSDAVLYVGSLKQVKDPMTFVCACRGVIESGMDARFIIAGDGKLKKEIETYIYSNGLSERFMLLGEVPYGEIPYREASVFVNSSLRESSCNSLLEALSFGIPVVATDNQGNRSVLGGLNGHRLVPVSDSGEMSGAIRCLLEMDRESRRAIFEESRELIRSEYSVSGMVDRYIETFLGR